MAARLPPVPVPTVEARPKPPPTPPSVPRLGRCMSGSNPTLSEAVVRRVLDVCHEVDHNAKLVNMTRDPNGDCHLRIRAGDVHSVASLQSGLQDAMPLSTCSVEESWLDGTLEAEVTVYGAGEEYRRARALVTRGRLPSYWIGIATICLLLGMGEWAAAVRASWARVAAKDEL